MVKGLGLCFYCHSGFSAFTFYRFYWIQSLGGTKILQAECTAKNKKQKTKTPQTLKRKINKVKWNWRLRNAESHACVLTSMQLKNWEASFPQRPDLQKKETYLLTNDYMHRIPPHPQAKELTVGTLAGLPRLCTPCLQALNRLAYNFATACVSQLAIPLLSLNKLNFWSFELVSVYFFI